MERMEGISRLIKAMGAIRWENPTEACLQAEGVLTDAWAEREELMLNLRDHIQGLDLVAITRTAELHSWLLYDGGPWLVKLNQFLPSPNVGKRSENVHDHTRPLISLTLAGWYTQNYYDPCVLRGDYNLGDEFRLEDLPSFPGPTTHAGMVYSVDTDTFHALTDFEDGTLTLCVYGAITKDQIRVFNCVSGRVEQRTTCKYAKQLMLRRLSALAAEGVLA